MDKEILEKRLEDIQKAIDNSLAQHHMLLGRLEEVKYTIEQLNLQSAVEPDDKEEADNE